MSLMLFYNYLQRKQLFLVNFLMEKQGSIIFALKMVFNPIPAVVFFYITQKVLV